MLDGHRSTGSPLISKSTPQGAFSPWIDAEIIAGICEQGRGQEISESECTLQSTVIAP